ncbi:uncharacterized protein LOC143693582 [Agelaius phoeniceus]|uniref:uncharacterized protein LOC143693582 n=1 Tax=Agelaius phoeniceus TaxID=39638 RepID=UPI00405515DC
MVPSKSLPSGAFVRSIMEQLALVSLSKACKRLKKHPARLVGSAPCQQPPHSHKHTKPQKERERIFLMLQLSGPSELQRGPEEPWEEADCLFPRQHKSPSVTEKVRRKTERRIRDSTARDLPKPAKLSMN